MTRRAWTASLVRARQAKEDIARERLAHARLHAEAAAVEVCRHDERISEMLAGPEPLDVSELIVVSERRARATATLVEAQHACAVAADQVRIRSVSVTEAAVARRSAEKLVERDEVEEARSLAHAEEQALDEIATRRRVS
jgi:hypothetical protein